VTPGGYHRNVESEESRPRLRGIFHFYAFFAAVAGGAVLVGIADGLSARLAAAIYGAALAAMFGASALYHRVPWRSAVWRLRARRLDHSMIFVFIAGTYTPFVILVLNGWLRVGLIIGVWGAALLGLVLSLLWIHAPRWLVAVAYLAVGWVGAPAIPQLFRDDGIASTVLLAVGGGLYSLGALAYATKRPNPLPGHVGFHEVFHLLVVAAAGTQFVAVSLVVT
jgi:hemolysin III